MRFTRLAFFVLIAQLAGVIGSVFTFSAIPTWYANLNKPVFSPPNWIFAPVWTILYFLMGIAAYLIWEKGSEKKQVRQALAVFIVQLILNSFWSIIFFGLQNPALAFLEIVILWALILLTIIRFYKISKVAGILLFPYLAWSTFATILNLAIVFLN